jgi:hypothetical protein
MNFGAGEAIGLPGFFLLIIGAVWVPAPWVLRRRAGARTAGMQAAAMAGSSPPMGRLCPTCDQRFPEGVNFCPDDGATLKAGS